MTSSEREDDGDAPVTDFGSIDVQQAGTERADATALCESDVGMIAASNSRDAPGVVVASTLKVWAPALVR